MLTTNASQRVRPTLADTQRPHARLGTQSVTASPKPARTHAHPPSPLPQVEWHQGDAMKPETYAHLLPGTTAVVHTIGTLFEKSGYKSALKDGSVPHFASSVAAGVAGAGASANPLEKEEKRQEGTYAAINRDTGASSLSCAVPCAMGADGSFPHCPHILARAHA